MTVAAPVMGGDTGHEVVVAAVVAIVSFQEVFKAVHQSTSRSERELLDAGLPVVFVVDQNGRAVAHPEASVAFSEKPMTDGNARLVCDGGTGQELAAGGNCHSG